MPAGILYFSMLEQMIKSDRRMVQEEEAEQNKFRNENKVQEV